jgi:hypothetical protein
VFPNVVCTEMLEHDLYPRLTLPEIARVMPHGGTLLLSTRGIGFHDDPGGDYPDMWRFTQASIEHLLDLAGLLPATIDPDPFPDHPGWLVVATR